MRWLCQCLLLALHFSVHLDFPILTLSDETMQHLDIPHPNDMYSLSNRKQEKIAVGQGDPNISTFSGAGSDSTKKAAPGEAALPCRQGCRAGNRHPSTGRGAWGWGAAPPPGTFVCQNYDQNHATWHWAFQSDQHLPCTAWKRRRISKYWNGLVLAGMDTGADSASPVLVRGPPASLLPELIRSLPAPCWQAKAWRKILQLKWFLKVSVQQQPH